MKGNCKDKLFRDLLSLVAVMAVSQAGVYLFVLWFDAGGFWYFR